MNNFYHKLAIASIYTALGFAIGASEEAKAATFNFNSAFYYPNPMFQVYDGGSFGSFDGLGDAVSSVARPDPDSGHRHSWDLAERTTVREVAALTEFSIPFLAEVSTGRRTDTRITDIYSAVLRVQVEWGYTFNEGPRTLSLFGYVGNGTAEASDLEAGTFLDSVTSSRANSSRYAYFNVTPFLSTLVSNNNEFAGFAVRSLTEDQFFLSYEGGSGRIAPPTLLVQGGYEVVPEPTTIFGSALALGVGGWLKRKKSGQHNKTTSQH